MLYFREERAGGNLQIGIIENGRKQGKFTCR